MAHEPPDPGLPIKLGPCSNGEFAPPPPSPLVRAAARRARADADALARRLGLSRRDFLRSTCGAAATLLAIAACSGDASRSEGRSPGGTYRVPPESTTEPEAAEEALGGDGPVFDVQNHLLEYDLDGPPPASWFGSAFPQASCGEDDPRACYTIERWLQAVFLESDTTMAVLSAVPVVGDPDPLSAAVMDEARRLADVLCGDGRVLIQGHPVPNVGRLDAALAAMEEVAAAYDLAAWKVYTHVAEPWRLDDPTGEAFLGQVEALGPPVVAVHKGLAGGTPAASPADVGPAAAAHPDLAFVVYHSGYETGVAEGPYDPAGAGVDRLLAAVDAAGIGPGGNVYAELGSTWRLLMGSPDEAAHVLGKLLARLGEDNVLWGTDSIWYGSPQDQIQAFRAFEIAEELQERHGYPALTAELKAKVLGGNAARLYGVDLEAAACRATSDEVEGLREALAPSNRTFGPTTEQAAREVFARDHPWATRR